MNALDEARDPSTTTRRLTKLAQDAGPEVLKAIAANPNSSDVLLGKLVFRYPAQVLDNPRVGLFALAGETPPFLPPGGRVLLYTQPNAPLELLDAGARSNDALIGLALLANPAATRRSSNWAKSLEAVETFSALLGQLPRLATPDAKRLGDFFLILDPHATLAELEAELKALDDHGTLRPRLRALTTATCRRSDVSADFVRRLLELALRHLWRVSSSLLRRPGDELTAQLLDNVQKLIRHPSLVPQLVPLALDAQHFFSASGLRAWAAAALRDGGHDATPVLALSRDRRPRERAIAAHATRDAHELARLAEDPEPTVRSAVATNPNAAPHTLAHLLADPDTSAVALLALSAGRKHDVVLAAALDCPWAPVRRQVAQDTESSSALAALAGDRCPFVRATVGARGPTPEPILRQLATDPLPIVRAGVARNARTPVDLLERLARDPIPAVRRSVRTNLHAPNAIRQAARS